MAIIHAAAEGHVRVCGPHSCWEPCCCMGPVLWPETNLMSAVAGGRVDVHSLCCDQSRCGYPWSVLLLQAMLRSVLHVNAEGHVDVCGRLAAFVCQLDTGSMRQRERSLLGT